MSEDLISKEKAYEVLSEYYHHKTEIQHKALREALDRVPSADIDLSDYSDRLWRNAYEQGKADAEPGWIPVTERLPDDDSACFVTVKYRDIRYTDIAHCFASKDSSVRSWVGANDDDVLAWLPLPEPWKGEEE